MGSMNRVVIIGNLTRDPESRNAGDHIVCTMRLAHSDYKGKPAYFDVQAWGKLGQNCQAHLTKGRQICVDGRLSWREWTKDDQKREFVSITAESIDFLGGDKKQESLLDEPADVEEPVPF